MDDNIEFKKYYDGLKQVIESLDEGEVNRVLSVLIDCKKRGGVVYLIGNGGSASTAEHWVNDLMKIGELRVVALTNISMITALGNDLSYEDIFIEQLNVMLKKGDVVLGISGSGNSMNVVKAMEYVRDKGEIAVGILGFRGGRIKEILEEYEKGSYVHVKSEDYGFIEDLHLSLGHYFARRLKETDNNLI